MPLTAKYPATCALCTAPITPGEKIAKAGRQWVHAACSAAGVGALFTAEETAATPGPVIPAPVTADHGEPGALQVWTDGACSGNPGPGGWAWATRDGRQDSGGAAAATNQRMEIQAALEAVRALPGPLIVVSDSTYVVNCFRDGWWRGWLARGWLTSAKKPVANQDLWAPLVTLVRDRGDVEFRWVKGHSGDRMNDLVDALAVAAGKVAAGRVTAGRVTAGRPAAE